MNCWDRQMDGLQQANKTDKIPSERTDKDGVGRGGDTDRLAHTRPETNGLRGGLEKESVLSAFSVMLMDSGLLRWGRCPHSAHFSI